MQQLRVVRYERVAADPSCRECDARRRCIERDPDVAAHRVEHAVDEDELSEDSGHDSSPVAKAQCGRVANRLRYEIGAGRKNVPREELADAEGLLGVSLALAWKTRS